MTALTPTPYYVHASGPGWVRAFGPFPFIGEAEDRVVMLGDYARRQNERLIGTVVDAAGTVLREFTCDAEGLHWQSERAIVTWTPEKLSRFVVAISQAEQTPSQPIFEFEGLAYDVGYARYLRDYLRERFAGSAR